MRRILLAVLTSLVLCSGCVAALPIPMFGHTGNYKGIGDGEVEFIKKGETTLTDVILKLGAPTWSNENTITYSTEKYGGGVFWGWAIGAQYAAIGNAGLSMRILPGYFEITFDESSVVEDFRFVELESTWNTSRMCEGICR